MKYIFLSGIHGVGKSTLAAKLKNEVEIETLSVSDLIRRAGKRIIASNKNTRDIEQNQVLWKQELKNLDIGNAILLLDGHFCLLDLEKNITSLPYATFEGTEMEKIVFVQNSPSVIRERLIKRDQVDYSIEFLEEFQNCELQQAIGYSEENEIDIFIYNEEVAFSKLINFIIK